MLSKQSPGSDTNNPKISSPKPWWGLLWWLSRKESACQCRWRGFDPWVKKIPWSRKWQPTSVSLPGISHGQRNLAGYSPWRHKASDKTSQLNDNKKADDSKEGWSLGQISQQLKWREDVMSYTVFFFWQNNAYKLICKSPVFSRNEAPAKTSSERPGERDTGLWNGPWLPPRSHKTHGCCSNRWCS